MKNILIPTDFSDNAWNALFTATKLYADIRCHFYLLNAHEPNFTNLLSNKGEQRLGIIYDSMEAYSNQELDKVLDYLKKNHKNKKHRFDRISFTEDLVTAIAETLLKKDIDSIVMGTKGATGAKEIFIGSNTVKVIKAIRNRPIVAVPESYDIQSLRQIIFPTDFTRTYENFELQPMVALSKLWQAQILVFQVGQEFLMSDTQITNKEALTKRLEGTTHSFHQVKFKSGVAKAIDDFAEEKEADMIALIHYRHTFMEKLTREPVIKKVAFQTEVPLLVLPE